MDACIFWTFFCAALPPRFQVFWTLFFLHLTRLLLLQSATCLPSDNKAANCTCISCVQLPSPSHPPSSVRLLSSQSSSSSLPPLSSSPQLHYSRSPSIPLSPLPSRPPPCARSRATRFSAQKTAYRFSCKYSNRVCHSNRHPSTCFLPPRPAMFLTSTALISSFQSSSSLLTRPAAQYATLSSKGRTCFSVARTAHWGWSAP